jgi:hypothetical protein
MPRCASCGADAVRVHRSVPERWFYADKFKCKNCGKRNRRMHTRLAAKLRHLFSLRTHCPRCGTPDVVRRTKRDKIESFAPSFLSRVFRLTGAPVWFCSACRLQYNDWRGRGA